MGIEKLITAIFIAVLMASCAPLVVGAGVGVGLVAHRDWCIHHTGNIYCDRAMPMGVHR